MSSLCDVHGEFSLVVIDDAWIVDRVKRTDASPVDIITTLEEGAERGSLVQSGVETPGHLTPPSKNEMVSARAPPTSGASAGRSADGLTEMPCSMTPTATDGSP